MKANPLSSSHAPFARNSGKGTAALRAIETQKGDNALIKDPYAQLLAGEAGFAWVDSLPDHTRLFFIDMLAVRTRIFDEHCCGSVHSNADIFSQGRNNDSNQITEKRRTKK